MANYKPVGKIIHTASAFSGTIIPRNLTNANWGMLLVQGTAKHSNSVLASGGVLVWENTATGSLNTPNHKTFADAQGQYGVTCRAGVSLILKFYAA